MNPDLSAPLTHEEFVSLRDCAKGLMHRTIPAEHKDRLTQLGYIQELSGGLRLTNTGVADSTAIRAADLASDDQAAPTHPATCQTSLADSTEG
jgi:hypothetical protein